MRQVYGGPNMVGRFDCVVTCFFLDTAHNVLDYLEVIHRVLVVRTFSSCIILWMVKDDLLGVYLYTEQLLRRGVLAQEE